MLSGSSPSGGTSGRARIALYPGECASKFTDAVIAVEAQHAAHGPQCNVES